ncbi:Receptor-interacting serine/threonine-protein kinase 4 [Bienertia sinuspersici]
MKQCVVYLTERQQEAPAQNNILHLHVGKPFRNKKLKHEKKWDLMISTEFIVLEDEAGYWLMWKQNSNGDIPLHFAATFGHSNAVQALLERAKKVYEPADEVRMMLSMTSSNKDTALHEAARAGHARVVELLVQADPNCSNQYEPNEEAETPLYLAAEKGCTSSVLTILQNPNVLQHLAYKGPCGRTALHAAVQWGDSEMVSKMLEKDRLLIRIKNDEGLTQLHSTAVDYLQQQPLKTLLDYDKWSHQRCISKTI